MHRIYFIASLSNGQTITEGKGDYAVTTGELSPYQRLLAFCAKENVSITSLSLATADGRRWNLPSSGKNPKFKAFGDAPKPLSYKFFRKMGVDIINSVSQEQETYSVIEATYPTHKLQVWVDERTGNSWSLII
jgi:hypothetical protein